MSQENQEEPKRIFVILGHTAAIRPDFTLNDLPGSAGRMDILARFITASLCLSHGIRKDVAVYLILRDQITMRFAGAHVKRLNPDERSTGALIKNSLEIFLKSSAQQDPEIEGTPGVYVSRRGFREILDLLRQQHIACHLLDEHGEDIRSIEIEEPSAFILSDHQNILPHELELLTSCKKLSLGPVVLHADHCVTLVHNELDRRAISVNGVIE